MIIVKHLLATPEKVSMFKRKGDFIKFANLIKTENEDEGEVNTKDEGLIYIKQFCPNLEILK